MLNWNDIISFVNHGSPTAAKKVVKTEQQWRELLTPDVFKITRHKATEPAHSSDMCSRFEPGQYACACCGTPLFDATEKFDSRSGWPSFTQPIAVENIAYHKDTSYGMIRVETVCNVCDAHLGHIFPDGPAPSGLRYCINALSLNKIK